MYFKPIDRSAITIARTVLKSTKPADRPKAEELVHQIFGVGSIVPLLGVGCPPTVVGAVAL